MAGRVQLGGGVVPDRLQQPVAGAGVAALDLEHRLVRQPPQPVGPLRPAQRVLTADRLYGVGADRPGEDREALQEGPLQRYQELVAPVESRAQSPVPVVARLSTGAT